MKIRKIVVVLCLFLFFTCPASLVSQNKALQQLVLQQRATIRAEIAKAPPEVQQRTQEVPVVNQQEVQQVTVPQPTEKKVSMVSDAQKAILVSTVSEFVARTSRSRDRFVLIATTAVFVGAALALISAITSFLGFRVTAGVIGLVATAVVGSSSVYPSAALANFYRALSAQGTALQLDCTLKTPLTEEDYEANRNQLEVLVLFEGTKRPEIGNAKDVSDDLSKQLQLIRTGAHVNAEASNRIGEMGAKGL
jgi:hypothetical protein